MFKVTLPGPVMIPDGFLPQFLSAVGAATVELVDEGKKNSAPEANTGGSTVTAMGSTVTAMASKPRGRPAKETPKEKPEEDPAPPAGNHNRHNLAGSEVVDRSALLDQFTALVDADYDKALEALTNFKVTRFSEVPDDKLAEFAKAIS